MDSSNSESLDMNTPSSDAFNLDTLLNNYTDEDLYKAFNSEEVSNPISLPVLDGTTTYESTQEYPDLASLDLTGLGFLHEEVNFNQVQPEYSVVPVKQEENAEKIKRVAATPKRTRASKKPKIEVKEEPNVVYVDYPSSSRKGEDPKYSKRLIANKKSAQASRERKKVLKVELEQKLKELATENSSLGTQITQLETENKVLKSEFVHLQRMISESPILSKMLARSNMEGLPELDEQRNATNSNKCCMRLFNGHAIFFWTTFYKCPNDQL